MNCDQYSLDEVYKDLVVQREKVKKEAEHTQIRYIKRFGELIKKDYELKIECIRLKKTISFCQAKVNHGDAILRDDLNAYLETTLDKYYEELQTIVEITNAEGKPITDIELFKIKRLYRKLAFVLHPDLHPELFSIDGVSELWARINDSYHENDYSSLQSLEVLVNVFLKEHGLSSCDVKIDDVDKKIEAIKDEIEKITQNDPYRLKDLLNDEEAVIAKENEFKQSIKENQSYLIELQNEVKRFNVVEYN